jgi:predicted double-glycine peptidase
MLNEDQALLISEQLGRLKDNIEARFQKIETAIGHQVALDNERLGSIRGELVDLKEAVKDHEQRIRSATDGVTQFKVFSGLANGGSGILSIVAMIKAFFGG